MICPCPLSAVTFASLRQRCICRFVVVPQLFDPPTLKRIQSAWKRAQDPARALWEESKARGVGAQGLSFENQAEIMQVRRSTFISSSPSALRLVSLTPPPHLSGP